MNGLKEFLVVTHESNQNWSVCVYNYNTGNIEHIYKNGGTATSKTLCQVGNDYVLTAEKEKPLLHVWPVNSAEQIKNVKFVLPEAARAVAVHPSTNYLAVASHTKLYVWHLNSGSLLNVLQKHYLSITSVKFSSSGGEYLVTTGEDGMLVTYKFSDVVNLHNNYLLVQSEVGRCEPLYCRTDSSCPILDFHLGCFGAKSRLSTISGDQTCRIYDLHTGTQLLVLVLDVSPSAVVLDSPCWNLFVGTEKGHIRLVNLKDPPRTLEYHIETTQNQSELTFVGHQKRVICLSLNAAGVILASGSEDGSFIIWEVKSKNILRKIEKGPITNLTFVQAHENMNLQVLKPRVILKSLQRSIENNIAKYSVSIMHEDNITFSDEDEEKVKQNESSCSDLENELINAKILNKQLYNAIVKISKKYNAVK